MQETQIWRKHQVTTNFNSNMLVNPLIKLICW